MRTRPFGWLVILAALSASTAVSARCKLAATPPIPVTMRGLTPTILTRINGVKARFLVDTGSFTNLLTTAAANQYHLPLQDAQPDESLWDMFAREQGGGVSVIGVGGGEVTPQFATVKTFTYMGIPFHGIPFMVIPDQFATGTVGLLGNNLLSTTDVEFDFPHGVMRLVKATGCGNQPLAYWARNQPVAVVDIGAPSAEDPSIVGGGSVDGHPIRIVFDTGAQRSLLSLNVAREAGVTPKSPGVVPAGSFSGVGGGTIKTWNAPIATLQIGTEKIEHTHILIADLGAKNLTAAGGTDLLLGADFFLSHRVYVSYHQRKIYFTYSGGPIFDQGQPASAWKHTSAGAPGKSGPTARTAGSDAPVTADAYLREGLAFAAQREFHRALADLDRACQLDPKNAEYRYQRGKLYVRTQQPDLALADFASAIRLRPNYAQPRMARAALRLSTQHWPDDAAKAAALAAVGTDLDAVDRMSPPDADLRLRLGALYDDLGRFKAAIHQDDLWLHAHPDDSSRAPALSARCWERAEADVHLQEALDDCNRALDDSSHDPDTLDSRALVYLRLNQTAKAIDDYDSALKRSPKMPTSFYGRGLAELREGAKAKGRTDFAAAEKLDAGIARQFARMGLKP